MRMRFGYFYVGTLASALVSGVFAKEAGKPEVAVSRPSLPKISTLELEPAKLTLHDARDARRILVWGKTTEGAKIDLTSDAKFACDSDAISVDTDGSRLSVSTVLR